MREIKFRAWDKPYQSMCYRDIHSISWRNSYGDLIEQICEGDERTKIIMQYTGLKDKNGKEIYEGDILRYRSLNPPYNAIEFHQGALGYFVMKDEPFGYFVPISETYTKPDYWQVIGNIHENPELLEASNERA